MVFLCSIDWSWTLNSPASELRNAGITDMPLHPVWNWFLRLKFKCWSIFSFE
jgi:hypothetical protein